MDDGAIIGREQLRQVAVVGRAKARANGKAAALSFRKYIRKITSFVYKKVCLESTSVAIAEATRARVG